MKQRLQGAAVAAVAAVITLILAVSVLSGGENKKGEVDDVIQPIPLREELGAGFFENYRDLLEELDEDCDC